MKTRLPDCSSAQDRLGPCCPSCWEDYWEYGYPLGDGEDARGHWLHCCCHADYVPTQADIAAAMPKKAHDG